MNSKVKEMWLKALRSGNYRQTRGILRDGNGFCCLGVLCDLAVNEGVPVTVTPSDSSLGSFFLYDDYDTVLPVSVMRWAGLETDDPEVIIMDPAIPYQTLAGMNDNGYDFNKIASVIEAQF